MGFQERVSVIIDVTTEKARSALSSFRTAVGEADGFVGKLKAGATSAFDTIKANAATMAVAAGGALISFGIKSVTAFQDAALEAGKFADATGITVEQASRLSEVAGDLGIDVGAVEGAMLKFNKALGDGKLDLQQFGTDIVYAKDGSVDAYESFINAATAIGAIEDPTKRAQAAQKAFGKSYGEIAELMEMDADDLRAALKGVSDSKVINEKELARAKEFRAALDNLKDRLEDIMLQLGGSLVPILTDVADAIGIIDDSIKSLGLEEGLGTVLTAGYELSGLNSVVDSLKTIDEIINGKDLDGITEVVTERFKELAEEGKNVSESADGVAESFDSLSKEARDDADALAEQRIEAAAAKREANALKVEFDQLNEAYGRLTGSLDNAEAWDNLQVKMWEYHADTDVSEQDTRDYIRALADMVMGLEGVPDETKAALITQLEDGDIAVIEAYLSEWSKGVNVPVRFQGQGQVGFMKNARGTESSPGGLTLVGEEGPEIVNMPRGSQVTPANRTKSMLNNATTQPVVHNTTQNLYINVQSVTPEGINRLTQRYNRRNGLS